MVDIQKASKKLNLTPQQVRNLCRDGKIDAKKIGSSWGIEEKEVDRYYSESSCGMVADQQLALYKKKVKHPLVLSFFSGAMGLDIGLEKAGFHTYLASEINTACRKTILKNKPDLALIGDIRSYTPDQILEQAGLTRTDDIDLMAGGPPCQAFSTAGKRRGFEDERGNVFLKFIDLILDLKPKYAVIENVRGLLSAPLKHRPHSQRGEGFPPLEVDELKGGALFYIINKLEDAGYGVSFNLYNAANFGTPQKRERVILICSRDGKKPPYLIPTHAETDTDFAKWNTFRKVTKDLSDIEHHFVKFPEKRLRYYRMLTAGQNWRSLSEELQKEALGASYYSGGGKTGFLRRLSWDKPAPTLVTHPAMPATDLAHPSEDRPLSIEEYKRLQEFPDDWKIEGTLLEQYKQVGNAVPVSLGYAVGNLIKMLLDEEEIPQFPDFKYSRYKITDEETWLRDFEKNIAKFSPVQ